jgi:hypothetical protein
MHVIAVCVCISSENWIFMLYKFDDNLSLCLHVPEDGLYVPTHVRQCRPVPQGSAMYIVNLTVSAFVNK